LEKKKIIGSRSILKTFLLSYLVYSQIWLNLFAHGHQFGYIRRWKKKNTPGLPSFLPLVHERSISSDDDNICIRPSVRPSVPSRWRQKCRLKEQLVPCSL
jgi:hypothetical protein